MFTSRNIHFAILGVILGAACGYIVGFYQVQKTILPAAPAVKTGSRLPEGHPEVNREQLLATVKERLAQNPTDPVLMTGYANLLFDLGRFAESVEWFRKVLTIRPDDPGVHTDLGTALWNAGRKEEALAEYQKALDANPKHVATLYNLVLVRLEQRDLQAASGLIRQIESIDPKYDGLDLLKKRVESGAATP